MEMFRFDEEFSKESQNKDMIKIENNKNVPKTDYKNNDETQKILIK
jgi:hypothetical protein